MCFPCSILDSITGGNNVLCVYDRMFNPTVKLHINRFLSYLIFVLPILSVNYFADGHHDTGANDSP